ncbi:MAG: prolyl oligopeptidase family serine peptidase [Pyrinomonadaceae bacterium]|nr:prolyl oligopeptidase family serine peptidase [Pyrinomonadaceae bacterium]
MKRVSTLKCGSFLLSVTTVLIAVLGAGLTSNCQVTKKEALSVQLANQTPASSPATRKVFVERSHTDAQGETMPYLLFVPAGYDKTKPYPLVLWLHGGGTRGNDLKLLLGHGDQTGIGFFARADNQAKYPSLILAPQCPQNKFWGNSDSDHPTNEMRLVLEILDRVRADYSVDSGRLYVMGMSLGGYGTWDILVRRPRTFAAAIPICGGGNPSKAAVIARTPIWVFHGDEDESVNVSESRRMVAALKKAGGQPRYTEYKGVGHNSWVPAFKEPDFLSWLFAQSRSR